MKNKKNKKYLKETFYKERDASLRSAEIMFPIVLNLIDVKSVVDIGCGTGEFLKVFYDNGIKDILGIDGSWIKKENLKIPQEKFMQEDLTSKINVGRRFDLAISLEVGEHLPKESAECFIDTLTGLSKVVLFSAAIPLQGGDKHINEQWGTYWKELFDKRDYVLIDCIRKRIWNNENVNAWYCQNTFMFIKKSLIKDFPKLNKEYKDTNEEMLSLVHPRIYLPKARIYNLLMKYIPKPIKKIKSKIRPNI